MIYSLKLWMGILCLGWIQAGFAQVELPEDATLAGLNLEYDVMRSNLAKPLVDLQGKYEAQLKKLRDQVKAAGDLDKTLAVHEVLEGFRKEPTKLAGDDFPELRRLQTIYADEAVRLNDLASQDLKTLVEAQKARLEMLQIQLTQQGKLTEAKETKETLAEMDETLGVVIPKFADEGPPATPSEVVWIGEKGPFEVGALQFTNRDYVWTKIPEKFVGWQMSMQDGGSEVDSRIKVKNAGLVYAVIDKAVEIHFNMDGWKTVASPTGGRGGGDQYKIVEKAFESGNYTLPGKGWFTTRILLPPKAESEP